MRRTIQRVELCHGDAAARADTDIGRGAFEVGLVAAGEDDVGTRGRGLARESAGDRGGGTEDQPMGSNHRQGAGRFFSFLKKKKQKTFDSWCHAGRRSLRVAQSGKSFLLLFFKKKCFLPLYVSSRSLNRRAIPDCILPAGSTSASTSRNAPNCGYIARNPRQTATRPCPDRPAHLHRA